MINAKRETEVHPEERVAEMCGMNELFLPLGGLENSRTRIKRNTLKGNKFQRNSEF